MIGKNRGALRRLRLLAALAALVTGGAGGARAEEATVAVAANFKGVVERLAPMFAEATGHTLTVSAGSSGKLYTQIKNGAPFDVMLSADQQRPALLETEGGGAPGSRFTYAVGRLVLWSADPSAVGDDGAATLRRGDFRNVALANPETAPYGAAAVEALRALGLEETLRPKIVQGENIGQTFQLVSTGNAELGFVALSQALDPKAGAKGGRWDVPADLYAPIRQDAILLDHGAGNPAARAFLDFLKGDAAHEVIAAAGYGFEGS